MTKCWYSWTETENGQAVRYNCQEEGLYAWDADVAVSGDREVYCKIHIIVVYDQKRLQITQNYQQSLKNLLETFQHALAWRWQDKK